MQVCVGLYVGVCGALCRCVLVEFRHHRLIDLHARN